MRLLLLLPLVALVIAVSGCTGLPFLNPGVSYADDIIVVRELTAVPEKIGKGQTVKVLAYIENLGEKSIGPKGDIQGEVSVVLYDYCQGLFDIADSRGFEGAGAGAPGGAVAGGLLPKETKLVEWTLRPAEGTRLTTACRLKVAAKYPYRTDGVTTVTFIDEAELQRQLQQGTFKPVISYNAKGFGPVKAWFDVRDQQPIPAVVGWSPVLLEIENTGSGFLAQNPGCGNTACIPKDQVKIELDSGLTTNKDSCRWAGDSSARTAADDVKLIKSKAPPLLCEIGLKDPASVEKDLTKRLQVTVDYLYEFRKEVPVTVEVV